MVREIEAKKELKRQASKTAAEQRAASRKQQCLKHKAQSLSNEDLIEIIQQRRQAETNKEKKRAAAAAASTKAPAASSSTEKGAKCAKPREE